MGTKPLMLAFLLIEGQIKPCCPGCALKLEKEGFVKRILTDEGDGVPLLGFALIEPYSVADCRDFIRAQQGHIH